MLNDRSEERRRDGKIVRRALGSLKFFAESLERRGISVVAVDVAQQTVQFLKGCRVESPMLFEAVFCARTELLRVPASPGYTDNRHIQVATLNHGLQRRKDFLVG